MGTHGRRNRPETYAGANLRGAVLRLAHFRNANLEGENLDEANLACTGHTVQIRHIEDSTWW